MSKYDDLEALIRILKRNGVMHYAGEVEIDFSCQTCAPTMAEEEDAPLASVIAIPERTKPEEPEVIDRATGLTKSQADELFHSSDA